MRHDWSRAPSIKEKPPVACEWQGPGVCNFWALPCGRESYFRTASFSTFAGRRRTTVLALILICSPVCGLRPMRALR